MNAPSAKAKTKTSLKEEIAALSSLPRADLVEHWVKAYDCPPPKGVKRQLLERAAAYHLQAKMFGGLKPAIRKSLLEMTNDESGTDANGSKDISMKKTRKINTPPNPGTRLVREWQGVTHTVHILEEGVLYKGQHFSSLSAVAMAITGAKWSGPRFFGL